MFLIYTTKFYAILIHLAISITKNYVLTDKEKVSVVVVNLFCL